MSDRTIDELWAVCSGPCMRMDEDEMRNRRTQRDAILDLAEKLDAEGLVLVPAEPTPEMAYWGHQAWDATYRTESIWSAMIEASVR